MQRKCTLILYGGQNKMYTPYPTKRYEKSFIKLKHSGKFNEIELNKVINILASGEKLGSSYQDHPLHGEYMGLRECHVRGDILLIYEKDEEKMLITLVNIGNHSELF